MIGRMKKILLLILSINLLQSLFAQQDSTGFAFSFNGYLKDLNTFSFPIHHQPSSYTQLLHNRMNLKWTSSNFNGSIEWRNRFFWGDLPRQDPMLASHLENVNEKISFPVVWTRNNNSLLHTNLERAWIEFKKNRWSYKLGRQRINWGMNNNWNPNDIFNAYNLLDFDYEERSGVDGFRISHVLGEMKTLEWAGAFHRGKDITTAIKYGFHTNGIDWQILTGIYRSMFTIGGGWQGSMGDWGVKGELQFFGSHQEQRSLFNGSMEIDRLTPNNGYLYWSILYTEAGLKHAPSIWTDLSFQNSPLKLMPAQWNLLAGFRKEISPRFNASIGLIHAPFVELWIFYPSVNFSVITNVDLDLFVQSFFGKNNDSFGVIGHTLFLRGKWSF
jgi:hypothetical protein